MTEAQRLARASQAEAFKPLLDEACAAIRSEITDVWAGTPLQQVATREQLYLSVAMLGRLQNAIVRFIADGQVIRSTAEMAELLAPAATDRR